MAQIVPLRTALPSIPLGRGSSRTWEHNPEFSYSAWFGRNGFAGMRREMLQSLPRMAAAEERIRKRFRDTELSVVPCGDKTRPETQMEGHFRELVTATLAHIATDVENGKGGLHEVLYAISEVLFTETWAGALTVFADPTIPLYGRRVEVFPVDLATLDVNGWNLDGRTGRLLGVRQQTTRGSAYLPREPKEGEGDSRLFHLSLRGQAGPADPPVQRAFAFWFVTLRSLMMSYASLARALRGRETIKETRPGALDVEASTLISQWIDEFRRVEEDVLVYTEGLEGSLEFPSTSWSPIEFLNYFDGMVDHAYAQYSQTLGATAGSGSRALGEVNKESEDDVWRSNVANVATLFIDELCFHLKRLWRIPASVRNPKLEPPQKQARIDVVALAPAITALKGAGMPTPASLWAHIAGAGGLELPDNVVADIVREATAPAPTVQPQLPAALPGQRPSAFTVRADADGCDRNDFAAVQTVTVRGADGRPFESPAPLVGVEAFVAWASNEDVRREADERLASKLAGIAREHANATYLAHADGYTTQEADSLRAEYEPKYQAAIESYADELRGAVEQQGREEIERQVAANPQGELFPEAERSDAILARWGQRQLNRAYADAQIAARTIASRVQSEAEQGVTSGVPQGAFASRITPGGLAYEARSVGSRVESVGRVTESALSLPPGFAIKSLMRTSVRDHRRCDVCKDRSGTSWELPEQLDEFLSDPKAQCPDPNCKGTARLCRCGLLVRVVRVETAAAA